jgi:hypothetical protein
MGMKKALFVIICLLLLFPLSTGEAIGQIEESKVDGYKWGSWNNSARVYFITGWLECGYVAGTSLCTFLYLAEMSGIMISVQPGEKSSSSACGKITEDFLRDHGLALYGLTVGQIKDTIDKIYSDPRVKPWLISDIMPLVRGRLKDGWTEKDLNEVIAYVIKQKELSIKLSGPSPESEDRLKYMHNKSEEEKEKLGKELKELMAAEPKVLRGLRGVYPFR